MTPMGDTAIKLKQRSSFHKNDKIYFNWLILIDVELYVCMYVIYIYTYKTLFVDYCLKCMVNFRFPVAVIIWYWNLLDTTINKIIIVFYFNYLQFKRKIKKKKIMADKGKDIRTKSNWEQRDQRDGDRDDRKIILF